MAPATAQAERTPQATKKRRALPWPIELYRSQLGKKYIMAITGVVWLGFVLAHMFGNTKLYFGAESINYYGEWLREGLGYPALPHQWTLWILRLGLIGALILHVSAAAQLTWTNKRTGTVVLLYLAYHLADLTFGWVNPDFVYGDVYGNVVASLSVWWVAAIYIVANVALGLHLLHGTHSLFSTLGAAGSKINRVKFQLATAIAGLVVVGNVLFPVMVQVGVIGEDPAPSTAEREARVEEIRESFK